MTGETVGSVPSYAAASYHDVPCALPNLSPSYLTRK